MGVALLILGLIILVVGGELLVKGSVTIANNFKISPLVIGMTIVSFGTSAPELLVSLQAALDGNPSIAIGNVVGSNIANLALVLAITVIIFPIVAERQTKIIDWPMMLLATVLFYIFSLDKQIILWEGATMVAILIIFTFLLVRNSIKQNKKTEKEEVVNEKGSTTVGLLLLLGGLVGLYFGSGWFVEGAVSIAKDFNLSDRVIGVTVVAFGTSAPELVASTVAAYRQQTDISVGNLIGSNLFNIMAVLGITSIVTPIAVEESVLNFDMYWVMGIALAMFPVLFIGKRIGRIKGVLLLATYVTYIVLVLSK